MKEKLRVKDKNVIILNFVQSGIEMDHYFQSIAFTQSMIAIDNNVHITRIETSIS